MVVMKLIILIMMQIKLVKKTTEIVIPLKHLSNSWRSLNILLINCEVELILTWTKNCALADMTVGNNPPTRLEFQITDTKLYVPVVTLPKENDIKLLEKLKSEQISITNDYSE